MATVVAAVFSAAVAAGTCGGRPPSECPRARSRGGSAWPGALAQLQQRGAVPVAAALGVSSVETGCAAVAIGAAVALITAVVQVFLIELPVAARRVAAGHGAAVLDRGARLALGAVAAGAAMALAGVLAGPPLIEAVLGDDFASAGDALAPALAAVPLAPIAAMGANHALLAGRTTTRVLLAGAGAIGFGVAALVLLSTVGDASDVALATLAGAAAAAAAAALYARPPAELTAGAAVAAAAIWGLGALTT